MTRSGILKLVLGGLIFVMAMFGQEWAVRFALPDYNPALHIRFLSAGGGTPHLGEPNLQTRQIKNTGDYNVSVNFNAHGFRDKNDVATGTADDLYLVGDSYSFGWGVEEDQAVAASLQGRVNRRVYNVSIPGDIDEYDLLLRHARRLGGDVKRVVLFVTMENDIHGYGRKAVTAAPQPAAKVSMLSRAKEFLTSHSALYLVGTSWIQQTPILKALFVRLGFITPNLHAAKGHAVTEQEIRSTVQRLGALAAEVELIVVLGPARRLWWGEASHRAAARQIHMTFVDMLTASGLKVVDLKPVFEADGKPLSRFYVNDPHWTPSTHAMIADAIFHHLPETWR